MSFQINDRLYWPEGKRKAFTLSYDDGIEQDRRLVRMMNERKVRGTFNLNSGLFGRKGRVAAGKKEVDHIKIPAEEIIRLYENHEVAGHGVNHESMYGMDTARCAEEILTCRKELEQITGRPLTGFAYAFGAVDENILNAVRLSGISYARTITSTYKFDIPLDFLQWNPTCHHDDERVMELADAFLSDDFYFSMYSPAKLFYVWGHSYEFDQNDNWDHMEKLLDKVAFKDDVWYATNGQIQSYVDAYRKLIFSVDSTKVYNPTCTSIWLGGIFSEKTVEVKPGEITELLPAIEM